MANLNTNLLVDEIKHELIELENQVKKGKKELNKAYKSRNSKFSNLLKNVHSYITEVEKKGEEKVKGLKSDSRYLLDTLESDFNFSYTDFSEKPQDVYVALHDFENSLQNFYDDLNSRTDQAKERVEKEWTANLKKLKMEIQQIQEKLDSSSVDIDEWKKSRLKEVMELKNRIDQKVLNSKNKIDLFNNEITEAYQHLKSAIKNLK